VVWNESRHTNVKTIHSAWRKWTRWRSRDVFRRAYSISSTMDYPILFVDNYATPIVLPSTHDQKIHAGGSTQSAKKFTTIQPNRFSLVSHSNQICTRTRDIFVTESASTSFRKFFLTRTQAGTAFHNLLPGIGITNTTPLRPNFGSLYALQNLLFFYTKMALIMTNTGWSSFIVVRGFLALCNNIYECMCY
jgi:hypothetical protein